MAGWRLKPLLVRGMSDYGMLVVLLLLCVYYSLATIEVQHPSGAWGAEELARQIVKEAGANASVLIAARSNQEDVEFADTLRERLAAAGLEVLDTVKGEPSDARAALDRIVRSGKRLDVIACNQVSASWPVFDNLGRKFPVLAQTRVSTPLSYRWPSFLMPGNLLNVTNQIVIIAILAIGMTMVILTGGIDLSVGSLIALSAVVATMLIRDRAGAEAATPLGMIVCCLAGIAVCGLIGLFTGLMVTVFKIPPFVVTLAMMLVARGVALICAEGQSIYQVPESFIWLGRGRDLAGIPNAVVLMLVFYAVAHVVMSRMSLGRYIYAVGGNVQAARLSGVRVDRILVLVYTICGVLAGLGGIILASQLRSGSPIYGNMYEMYTIAAVVVGGTSLAGGEGKILGTLIGAFIIAVIQNGMNLTGVSPYKQMVVLGSVLLGAVLIDTLRRQGRQVLLRAMFWRR